MVKCETGDKSLDDLGGVRGLEYCRRNSFVFVSLVTLKEKGGSFGEWTGYEKRYFCSLYKGETNLGWKGKHET